MTAVGQCTNCLRWAVRGGIVSEAVEGCTWFALREEAQLPPRAEALLEALAPLLAREGVCPGHLPPDLENMPDAYRSEDLPLEARRRDPEQGLITQVLERLR